MTFMILPRHPAVDLDAEIELRLHSDSGDTLPSPVSWKVVDDAGRSVGEMLDRSGYRRDAEGKPETTAGEVVWRAVRVQPGRYTVHANVTGGRDKGLERTEEITVHAPVIRLAQPVSVELQRTDIEKTPDEALWEVIRRGTSAISYRHYADWMDYLFCGDKRPSLFSRENETMRGELRKEFDAAGGVTLDRIGAPLPFPDMEGYKVLVAATQAFLELNCGVNPGRLLSLSDEDCRNLGLPGGSAVSALWEEYLEDKKFIPYLYRIRRELGGDRVTTEHRRESELCDKILERKFTSPCLLELIYVYWQEEGMLIQTVNAICMRFQNRRRLAGPDPLANLATDPLRPLSNLLWGYIQDEQHRLTVSRRAYEYDSEYGLTLVGQAVPPVRAAESRSGFLAAFHDLLHRAAVFYKEDDDTTIIADAFPVLSALGGVHLMLAEGANNQYRGLTWTARCEMLIQQWLLARPEFREFLPTRVMVAYPEPWMDRVDAMKRMQGWTGTSVRFFHDLARFGEQILLSVRYGDWSNVTNRDQAANWCRSWRQEVQWYIHAYQSVTGVDLSADMADVRQAEQAQARALPPAFHLQRRLAEQHRGSGAALGGQAALYPGRPV